MVARLLLLAAVVAVPPCVQPPRGAPPEFDCQPAVVLVAGGGFERCEWVWRCHEEEKTLHWRPVTLSPECLSRAMPGPGTAGAAAP